MSIFRKIPIKWVTHNLNEMQKHSLLIKKKNLSTSSSRINKNILENKEKRHHSYFTRRTLKDNSIDMVLISSIPKERADLSIKVLNSGKDVMVDKPGCTTLNQLEDLKRTVKQTGKIWSVNFSERFHVAAVAKAEQLVAEGKIGKVKQTMGTGPHRQGNYERPNWFYERESYGGIITDIGSHQIHQFLVFTNSNEAKITHSMVENTTKKEFPGFQDFGEINLTGNGGHGYIRLDWFTPDALPTWGDGRLFILGDKGFIEIRKYTDLAKSDSGSSAPVKSVAMTTKSGKREYQ